MQELNLQDILSNTMEITEKKVWYIAIIGRPNAWKSTFLNTLLWEKVSITSHIPQTTRKRVLAIFNDVESQIIFFDTPGIHKHAKEFNQQLNQEAIKSMRQAEWVLYFIDASREYGDEEKYIEELLEYINTPILKVYTKSDLPAKIIKKSWDQSVEISSVEKKWFEVLLQKIKQFLPLWHPYYPDDYYTDQDIYFRISEVIREKVFLHTKEELPHSVYIEIGELDDTPEILKIQAYIYTESESQKYIVVGRSGSLVTKIGTEARMDLEAIFGKKVFLSLRVKVMEKWRKNEKIIKKILQ